MNQFCHDLIEGDSFNYGIKAVIACTYNSDLLNRFEVSIDEEFFMLMDSSTVYGNAFIFSIFTSVYFKNTILPFHTIRLKYIHEIRS